MKKLILTIFVILNISLFATDNMKITIDNISIEAPVGWFAQYTKSPIIFYLYSPIEANDLFQENCNLATEILPTPYTVDEYKEVGVEILNTVYTQLQILESENNYHIIRGFVGETEVKQIQYFYIKSNIAYVLTFTSNPTDFARYLPIFESISQTFKY